MHFDSICIGSHPYNESEVMAQDIDRNTTTLVMYSIVIYLAINYNIVILYEY